MKGAKKIWNGSIKNAIWFQIEHSKQVLKQNGINEKVYEIGISKLIKGKKLLTNQKNAQVDYKLDRVVYQKSHL